MKTLPRIIPVMLLLVLLTGCGAPTPADSSAQPEGEAAPAWKSAQFFLSYATAQNRSEESLSQLTDDILSATGGQIYCNTYGGSSMGGDAELMQSVSSGSISIVHLSTAMQYSKVPETALFDIPYLFSESTHCNSLLSGELLDFFQPYYNKAGLQLLGWCCSGFRQLSSTFPLDTPQDLDRLKIRILDNPYHQLFWEAARAHPTAIPFSDLFYALQQSKVNAQENSLATTTSIDLDRVQPYLLRTNHLPFIDTVVMNKAVYDALSPENQNAVTQVFQRYCASSLNSMLSQDALSLEARFTRVSNPSPALQTRFLEASQAVRAKLEEELGAETVAAFYQILAQSEG